MSSATTSTEHDRSRPAVLSVTIASGIVGFTTTAVTVGTRGMAVELSLSTVQLGWVVNAYLVSAAAFVLLGGRLGDVIGRVRTYDIGLGVFAVSSLLGAFAPGFWVLLAARLGQGLGAALILPSSIEVVGEYCRRGAESDGFRWRGLAYASSFAIGPLVGGVLTDWYSWRWIFAIDVTLAVLAAVIASPLRNHPGRGSKRPTRDLLGAALTAALVALVVVLAERLAFWRLGSWPYLGTAAICIVLAALLVRHERRAEHPLLHPFIVRDHAVLGANLATVGASIGMLSLLYFFNLFAQSAATFDDAAVSVLLCVGPFVASMLLCALFAHWLGRRIGPRWPVTVGLGLMVAGFAMLAVVSERTTREQMLVPLALAGVGAGIANASLTSVAVLHLPAGRMNEAAGWISLSRFLGSAMALAVGTSTFLSVSATRATGSVAELAQRVAAQHPDGDVFDLAAASLERDLSGPLLAVTHATTADRFGRTMAVTAVILAAITVASWWLMRAAPTQDRRHAT